MERVIVRRRLSVFFLVVSALAGLAGLTLYWIDSSCLEAAWISSPTGLAFTVGGIAGLIVFVDGTY